MISAFSMSRSLVLRFAPRFFLLRVSALLLVYLRRMLLHRVSIRTLDELSSGKLGAGWDSRGESMLPFLSRSWKAKTRSQSSEHGVVAKEKVGHSSSSLFVEGHVRLLRRPDVVEQNFQLPCNRDDRLVPGCLPSREARCKPHCRSAESLQCGRRIWFGTTRLEGFGDIRCRPWMPS
jgi:hypothetical protein